MQGVRDLLAADTNKAEISAVLGKRFGCNQRVIDVVVGASAVEKEAEAATLRCGMLGTLAAATEAGRGVWEDCR
jgi:hypothetical protein